MNSVPLHLRHLEIASFWVDFPLTHSYILIYLSLYRIFEFLLLM
ncbi:hypothetical protein BVRB_4g097530 [Beta vulgaris subsp. vulgaris]|uniref:Uncharacterized protein n=1 Tax=Beta vulgaris subsp. vulgaris TaxID=3555 RepID=A0A0J8BD63_BETVV|nr:hypothetical protein BVRB_4g097530 [Beta vulgaris subsp. vulgaris]